MRVVRLAQWAAAAGAALLTLGACGGGEDGIPFGLNSEVVAPANHASEIAFAPDGRIFFAEQFTGDIRVIGADGTLQEEAFAHLDVANWVDLDWGLTGLALHPDFESNHYVYAFYTEPAAASGTPETPAAQATPTPAGETAVETQTPSASPAPETTAAGGPPPLGTAPGTTAPGTASPAPAPTQAPDTPGPTEAPPLGRPLLVRFTDREGKGEDLTVVSDAFPVTDQGNAGYNANGNIHFGPDGMLYVSLGDYDYGADNGLVQDLGSPIGKLLRIDPETGEAPPDNPYAGDPEADPRVFARGFREPFDFRFHPDTEAIYGTDNTPYSCEELNIIRAGQNYGWPDVGVFPFSDCNLGDQVRAIHFFAREGQQPGGFVSLVEVSGLAFTTASRYPALGDSLFICEGHRSLVDNKESPGVLRRLVLSGDAQVTADDVIVRDCKGDVEAAPDGTLYYANGAEIRRLLPGGSEGASSTVAPPSG